MVDDEEAPKEPMDKSTEIGENQAPSAPEGQPAYPQQSYYGASQPYPQQPYGQQPAYQQPAAPPQDMMSTIFWKSLWLLILLGGLLVLIGQIMLDVADYGTDEGMIKAGRILVTISAFMIGVPMAITGVYYDKVGDIVRFGLILGGVLILAFAFF